MLFPALVALGALAAAELTPAERYARDGFLAPVPVLNRSETAELVRFADAVEAAHGGRLPSAQTQNLHVERNDSLGAHLGHGVAEGGESGERLLVQRERRLVLALGMQQRGEMCK